MDSSQHYFPVQVFALIVVASGGTGMAVVVLGPVTTGLLTCQ